MRGVVVRDITPKRVDAGRRILVAIGIAFERVGAASSVGKASLVVKKRKIAGAGIVVSVVE